MRASSICRADVDFFVYSRDAPGASALRADDALLERHWSYMDGFAATMIARGPTLAPDRETATGSLHVLSLPSVDAVREFVAREPNNQAGVYGEHSVWRFENLLGRTMWEFAAASDAERRYLVLARGRSDPPALAELSAPLRERLILYGALATLDGAAVGVALAVQAPDRAELDSLLERERPLDAFRGRETQDWDFGGRPETKPIPR
jgi:uncharacterized protein YciI